jgi:penicillin G amidase
VRPRYAVLAIVVVLLVGVAIGGGSIAWITGRALPETSGTLQVRGLQAGATVRRDVNGIAQISATNPHDLFLAQGYVHAQERMWQMEVWRHISSGRLAELFGPGSTDDDRFIRTLGWRQTAERDLALLAPATRAVLDAYAEGVNAWLDTHRDKLGLSFIVTGANPEPWTALDTLAWGKVQAWNLGGNMASELFRYLADARLGDPAHTDELFPKREGSPVIVPGEGGGGGMEPPAGGEPPPDEEVPVPEGAATPTLTADQVDAWLDVGRLAHHSVALAGLDTSDGGLVSHHAVGSNDWVVGPAMSTTGGALLANDPHLGISMPSVWYINGLHCAPVTDACPYDVAGVTFPGVPGIILGHNARIAWGATNVEPDVQDLVVETPDPSDSSRYIGPGGEPRPFTERTERILVKGGDAVDLTVRETVHGPILNDVEPKLKDAPLMALRWTSTSPDAGPDRTVESFLKLMTAADFDAFRAALAGFVAPSQNFVYADVDGHIGYQMPGAIPIRSDPGDRGARPVSGADGTGEWTGMVPFDDLPSALDPPDGWIVTANNAVTDESYPHFIGDEFDPGYRAERIIDLINEYGQDGLNVPEMSAIQTDTAPLRARDIVLELGDAKPATSGGAVIAQRIADWDGSCVVDSRGCAAYMAWEYRVLRGIFDDELGPLARDYVGSAQSWVALENAIADPTWSWWDDTTTPEPETAEQIISRAMDAAGAELRAAFGDPDAWTWGRMHTATFREPTLGSSGIGPLEWYYNAGPLAVDGADGAIDASYYRLQRGYPDPEDPDFQPLGMDGLFTVTNLPSYRLLMDMSDIDGARIVITTGQSGVPFDRHYSDQIEPWRAGSTLPLPFTSSAIDAATVATLTLEPDR